MGLGKTFQVSAVLSGVMAAACTRRPQRGTVLGAGAAGKSRGPTFATALVVVPVSLIPTWEAELQVRE
jgi:SNF2 family DNA or RNA helicase